MSKFFQGLILLAVFMLMNVVFAGVVLALLPLWRALASDSPWAGLAIGGVALFMSFVFLRGALFYISRLQCDQGRRGG